MNVTIYSKRLITGDGPTREILVKKPELVHRVEFRFGVRFLVCKIIKNKKILRIITSFYVANIKQMQGVFQNLTWTTWDVDLDSVHLLINHRFYLDLHFKTYRYFNEHNIQHYPFVFGKMAQRVFDQPPIIDSKTG